MDTLTVIRQPIEEELKAYKRIFDASLQHSHNLLGTVLSHIGQRQGKMMRPILMLLVAKNYGSIGDNTLYSAATIELLHTASLVHDDVVDESNERRGQKSINAEYGNKVAVLVGDYLLSTALEHSALVGDFKVVDIVAKLGKTLAKGELLQLDSMNLTDFTEHSYYDVIKQKTAALFAACAEIGALTSGATAAEIEKARIFGETIGICFQIRDDIFDYYDAQSIGKPTGNDMREGKLTLPALYVLQKTGNAEMLDLAYKVRKGSILSDEIDRLVAFIKKNGGIDYAEEVMEKFCGEAYDFTSNMQNPDVAKALRLYVDFVAQRNK